MQHDISKLWDQVQQISLSQRATKYDMDGSKLDMEGLKYGMEANMDGLKANMEGLKDFMEFKMDGLKVDMKGLTKLLEERLPSGDKVIHKIHDEDQRNMNYDFRDSNLGFKNHHIPNIDMSKFDGNDAVT